MNALEKRFVLKLKQERDQARRKADGFARVVLTKADEVKELQHLVNKLMRVRAKAISSLV